MREWLNRLWYAKGPLPPSTRLLALPLAAVSLVFHGLVAWRNWAFDRGTRSSRVVRGVRVVSVGNLNVGGTGKTPAVIYIANLCLARGKRVAVVSRGYGRPAERARVICGASMHSDEVGDEPLLISRRCPSVPVLVGTDRVALAEQARGEFGAEIILLDDGMQHRRVWRDVEIVVIDEEVGLGNGHLLPWGPLREPPQSLGRANLLWIRASADGNPSLPRPAVPFVRARYWVQSLLDPTGVSGAVASLRGKKVFVFCGLARPLRVVRTVQNLGAESVGSRFFPDHHSFSARDLDSVLRLARARGAELIITSEKDFARLPKGFPAWALSLDVEITEGSEHLLRLLDL